MERDLYQELTNARQQLTQITDLLSKCTQGDPMYSVLFLQQKETRAYVLDLFKVALTVANKTS